MTPSQLERLGELVKLRFATEVLDCTDHPSAYLEFSPPGVDWYLGIGDRNNGDFVIWCLERLEELGFEYNISTVRGVHNGWGIHFVKFGQKGHMAASKNSRAEACALALLAALESEHG